MISWLRGKNYYLLLLLYCHRLLQYNSQYNTTNRPPAHPAGHPGNSKLSRRPHRVAVSCCLRKKVGAMKFVALVSGGKDSCYNTMEVSTGVFCRTWLFMFCPLPGTTVSGGRLKQGYENTSLWRFWWPSCELRACRPWVIVLYELPLFRFVIYSYVICAHCSQ